MDDNEVREPKEWWVMGRQGFWRKGQVNPGQHLRETYCTWTQVAEYCDKIRGIYNRQANERKELLARHNHEIGCFWASLPTGECDQQTVAQNPGMNNKADLMERER